MQLLALRALQESRAKLDSQGYMGLMVLQDSLDLQDHQGHVDHLDHLDHQGNLYRGHEQINYFSVPKRGSIC